MKRLVCLSLLWWLGFTLAASAAHQERRIRTFLGVTPGTTTEVELRANPAWGQPLAVPHPPQPEGRHRLVYKIQPWEQIAVVIEGGVVRTVDFVPPAVKADLDALGAPLKLGPLRPLAALPAGAEVGSPPDPGWRLLEPSDVYIVLCVEQVGDKQHVKWMRTYAPGRPPSPPPMAIAPFTDQQAQAHQERLVLDFHGVTPGTTTEAELRANRTWGQPLATAQSPQPDARSRLVYRIKPWEQIAVMIEGGVVRTIDFVPPAVAVDLEVFAAAFKLGPLKTLAALPAGAEVGSPPEPGWTLLEPNDVYSVLFVQQVGDKQHVKWMRTYAPGRSPPTAGDVSSPAGATEPSSKAARGHWPDRRILETDERLQGEDIQKREKAITDYGTGADLFSLGGWHDQSANCYWCSRQLEVVKTIPTSSWILLQIEVTDEVQEEARFKSFFEKLDPSARQLYYSGVRIRRVLPRGVAAQAGLLPGMKVLKIDDQEVRRVGDFERIVTGKLSANSVNLVVQDSEGKPLAVTVQRPGRR